MIFVDTGALLARYLAKDQFHSQAVDAWKDLDQRKERCLSTNLVLAECFTLLARRAGYRFAAQRARTIYASDRFEIVRPDLDDELSALKFFEKYADQKVSFVDCVSFAVMKAYRIPSAFTFDRHFQIAGYAMWAGGRHS